MPAEYEPTAKQRALVEIAAAIGIAQAEIAASGLASTRRRCAKLKFCPRSQQLVPQKPHTLEPPETGAGGPAAT
jgi:hypothetical protein